MNDLAALVSGWVQKAESDLTVAEMCIQRGAALDVACFHAQQAAEKYLKAYLIAVETPFPYIHNLERLLTLCAQTDPEFLTLNRAGNLLTPYATALRYDSEFWPTPAVAAEARDAAATIKAVALARLPFTPPGRAHGPADSG